MVTKVAYIMSRFPGLTETFILWEMSELEKLGIEIQLLPLIHEDEKVTHQEALPWMERVIFAKIFSRTAIKSNAKFVLQRPGFAFNLLWRTIMGNFTNFAFLIRSLYLLPKAVVLAGFCQKMGVEHIHAHYATHSAFLAWAISQISGITYSITVHAHDIFVHHTMLEEKLGQASFIISISEFNRQYLIDKVGQHLAEKIHVIHCGVRPEDYAHTASPIDHQTEKPFELLTIGSMRPYKGYPYLLQTCSILKKRRFNFHCNIIGDGVDREKIEAQIIQENLAEQVTLHGALPQEEVKEWFKKADCYLQPSIIAPNKKMEGIPVALMEALAAGLPVIASNISGIPELVKPGKTGWLVEEKNPPSLANAVIEISNNYKHAKDLALAGKSLVIEKFDIRNNAARLANHYRNF